MCLASKYSINIGWMNLWVDVCFEYVMQLLCLSASFLKKDDKEAVVWNLERSTKTIQGLRWSIQVTAVKHVGKFTMFIPERNKMLT